MYKRFSMPLRSLCGAYIVKRLLTWATVFYHTTISHLLVIFPTWLNSIVLDLCAADTPMRGLFCRMYRSLLQNTFIWELYTLYAGPYVTCQWHTHMSVTHTHISDTHIYQWHTHISVTHTHISHTHSMQVHMSHISDTHTYQWHTHISVTHTHISDTHTHQWHTHISVTHTHISDSPSPYSVRPDEANQHVRPLNIHADFASSGRTLDGQDDWERGILSLRERSMLLLMYAPHTPMRGTHGERTMKKSSALHSCW